VVINSVEASGIQQTVSPAAIRLRWAPLPILQTVDPIVIGSADFLKTRKSVSDSLGDEYRHRWQVPIPS
jgi:hypothetical protein